MKSVFAICGASRITLIIVAMASLPLATRNGNADAVAVSAAVQPETRPSGEPSAAVDSDIQMALAALAKNDVPLAADYVLRQLDRSPGDGEALALMAKCVRQSAADDCALGNQVEAENFLDLLSARIQAAGEARFQRDVQVAPLDDLVVRNREIQEIKDSINASADEQAGPHIDAAMNLADEAHHHWYTFRFNDRDKVREGLRELRWVYDRGSVISADVYGRYWQAMDRLKALVSDSEWTPLFAEAGYAQPEAAR